MTRIWTKLPDNASIKGSSVKLWVNERTSFPWNYYLANRFHFAVRLYSDNAQMTSKRGENKEVRYEPQASSVTDVLTTFWRPLCVIRVQTHGKMESIWFIQ